MPTNRFTNNAPPQELPFQFDSPGGLSQVPSLLSPGQYNSFGPTGSNSHTNGVGGMGHMLERMHNVADRDMLPQKRRKLYDDRQEDPRKATFNGGGRGGVIGEYMREMKEEGRKENIARGTAVDISSGLFLPVLLAKNTDYVS
jgi:hypothetical protein